MISSTNDAIPNAIQNIEDTKGKKTGGNSKDSIPNLIYYLIRIYRDIIGKDAAKNFILPKAQKSSYRGQLYLFIHAVFTVINKNYVTRCKNSRLKNPFIIALNDQSQALGKQIKRVFKKMATQKKNIIE